MAVASGWRWTDDLTPARPRTRRCCRHLRPSPRAEESARLAALLTLGHSWRRRGHAGLSGGSKTSITVPVGGRLFLMPLIYVAAYATIVHIIETHSLGFNPAATPEQSPNTQSDVCLSRLIQAGVDLITRTEEESKQVQVEQYLGGSVSGSPSVDSGSPEFPKSLGESMKELREGLGGGLHDKMTDRKKAADKTSTTNKPARGTCQPDLLV